MSVVGPWEAILPFRGGNSGRTSTSCGSRENERDGQVGGGGVALKELVR